jgi:hypothetical protein
MRALLPKSAGIDPACGKRKYIINRNMASAIKAKAMLLRLLCELGFSLGSIANSFLLVLF